jgi:hypothetical protein
VCALLGKIQRWMKKEQKEVMIDWANEDGLGVGRSTLGYGGDMRAQGGTHPSSLTTYENDLCCIWERLG